ncbi:MAG: PilZ domain-containing protein [Magnetococcales bacterium]|nr:PilZ domain-containing protein [Magnetococcales bacterium]
MPVPPAKASTSPSRSPAPSPAPHPEPGAGGRSRRKWERNQHQVPVQLRFDDGKPPPLECHTLDVSLNGVRLALPRRFPQGLRVGARGHLVLTVDGAPLEFPCRVVRFGRDFLILVLLGKSALFGQAVAHLAFQSLQAR